MRSILPAAVLIISLGCGKNEPTKASLAPYSEPAPKVNPEPPPPKPKAEPKVEPKQDPDAELKKNAKDMQEYVAKLKATVPIDVKEFTDKGFKAERYEIDPKRDAMLYTVMLKIDPVYLKDKITGEIKRYTRARMIRNEPRAGTGTVFEWITVVMQ